MAKSMTPPLTLIVAATLTNGIGKAATLPWRLPKEMAYFASVTSAAPEGTTNALVMGRKAWESIPLKFRPLKGRRNIVVSRDDKYGLGSNAADSHLASSISSALALLQDPSHSPPTHRAFSIGGSDIYRHTLPLAERVLLTRVLSPAFEDCDVFFPELGSEWIRRSHDELESWVGFEVPRGEVEEKGVKYEFQMWERAAWDGAREYH